MKQTAHLVISTLIFSTLIITTIHGSFEEEFDELIEDVDESIEKVNDKIDDYYELRLDQHTRNRQLYEAAKAHAARGVRSADSLVHMYEDHARAAGVSLDTCRDYYDTIKRIVMHSHMEKTNTFGDRVINDYAVLMSNTFRTLLVDMRDAIVAHVSNCEGNKPCLAHITPRIKSLWYAIELLDEYTDDMQVDDDEHVIAMGLSAAKFITAISGKDNENSAIARYVECAQSVLNEQSIAALQRFKSAHVAYSDLLEKSYELSAIASEERFKLRRADAHQRFENAIDNANALVSLIFERADADVINATDHAAAQNVVIDECAYTYTIQKRLLWTYLHWKAGSGVTRFDTYDDMVVELVNTFADDMEVHIGALYIEMLACKHDVACLATFGTTFRMWLLIVDAYYDLVNNFDNMYDEMVSESVTDFIHFSNIDRNNINTIMDSFHKCVEEKFNNKM